MKAYYGYLRSSFFLIGFVKVYDKFVRVGFYRSLGEFEDKLKTYQPTPKFNPGEFNDFIRDLRKYLSGRYAVDFNYLFRLEGTSFQQKVWMKVREIPYGEKRSYKWVAERIGKPKACRAVAGALAKNPLVLIIPCHRVVRTCGAVAGSGFGRRVREYLLKLEGAFGG